jgi:hypothetical protein
MLENCWYFLWYGFDVEGEGTVATKSEAHVAVGVDETG